MDENAFYAQLLGLLTCQRLVNNALDNLNISNTISILADPYAFKNIGYMKCIEWMGTLWEISSIDISYPRMVLSIGGVYNGDTTGFTASV